MNNLLAVIDDGTDSQPALEQAIIWAKKLQTSGATPTLTLLMPIYNYAAEINKMMAGTILNNLTKPIIHTREQWLDQITQDTLDRVSTKLGPLNIQIEKKVVWEKRPSKAVAAQILEAKEEKAPFDIIFKSLVHHPIHQRLLMRVEEWQIARISDVPVLLVREADFNESTHWIIGIDPEHSYHDELNEKIVHSVQQLQKTFGGKLQFLHARPTLSAQLAPLLSPYNGGEIIIDSNTLIDESKKSAALFMDKHGLSDDQLISESGDAAFVLRNWAKKFSNSLIVLGSTTHGNISDRWIGHVAESIIDYAETNVLVIKSN